MYQNMLVEKIKNSVFEWCLSIFNVKPLLLNLSTCPKELVLKDFSYQVWGEGGILGLVGFLTTEKNVLTILNDKNLFNRVSYDLEKRISLALADLYVKNFRIFGRCFRNGVCIKCFPRGVFNLHLHYGFNGLKFTNLLGELHFYISIGPRELLSRHYRVNMVIPRLYQ